MSSGEQVITGLATLALHWQEAVGWLVNFA
jgi:hypothetical protein